MSRTGEYLNEQSIGPDDMDVLRLNHPMAVIEPIGINDLFVLDGEEIRIARYMVCSDTMLPQMGTTTAMDGQLKEALLDNIGRGSASEAITSLLHNALKDGTAYVLDPTPIASGMIELRYDESSFDGVTYLFVIGSDWYDLDTSGITVATYAWFPEADDTAINQMVASMHHDLSLRHPNACIQIFDTDEKVRWSVSRAEGRGAQLNCIALVLLIVVLFGILGSYLIVCDQRMREFGILTGIGVAKSSIASELIMENIFLFGLASGLGCLLGTWAIGQVDYPGMLLTVRAETVAGVLGLGITLSLVMASVGIVKLNRVSLAVFCKRRINHAFT